MRTYLIFLLILYTFYNTAKSLWEHGLPFEPVHWILLVMCVLYIPLGILFGKKSWQQYKADKEKKEEEKQEALDAEKLRKQNFYIEAEEVSCAPETDEAGASDTSDDADKNVFDC